MAISIIIAPSGILAQFLDSIILITENQVETVCVMISGAVLARSVDFSLQLSNNEGENNNFKCIYTCKLL